MLSLLLSDAKAAVRKNLDEAGVNESAMFADGDNASLDDVIAKTLPEAVNIIHQSAPVEVLDGLIMSAEDVLSAGIEDGVLSFDIQKDFLRLVTFRAEDSPVPVALAVPEHSPVGRMQLNPYTRGVYDAPVLVLCQGKVRQSKDDAADTDKVTSFRYYTLSKDYDEPGEAIARFEYLPRYSYKSDTTSYNVAENVVDNIIYQLTAMVLSILGETNKAGYFFKLSSFNQ